ncbi:MAG: hypothetical protein ACREFS_13025 [Acetobacteraceae bacterium]
MAGDLLPLPALCVIVGAIVLWILLEYRPLGRRLCAIGINPLAVAFPAGAEEPIVPDLAFGVIAPGKIRV